MKTKLMSASGTVALIGIIWLMLLSTRDSVSAVGQLPASQVPTPTNSGPTDTTLIGRLQQETRGRVRIAYHARTDKVRFVGTDLEHPIPQPIGLATEATPEDAARGFLAIYGQLFGLTDQAQELTVMRTRTADRGRSFVRFQQVYQGIPVFGGELIIQLDADNNVISANGEILPELELAITPKVDSAAAQGVARRLVAKSYGLSADHLMVSEPELWVYNPILLKPDLNLSSLVWRIDVYPADLSPVDELVLVDAHRGSVLLHFNQVATARNRAIYDNRNDPNAGLPGYGPVRTEGQPATGIRDVDKVYDYAGDTYDFYRNIHSRDSIDNAGMTIVSTVRYCDPGRQCPYANAYWTPRHRQMVYGEGYSQADDVVTHEFTHGVTGYESNLVYAFQSGAINESFSDIWGEFVDLTNGAGTDTPGVRWLLGEDLPDDATRNMMDPPADGDPDKMSSTLYDCGGFDNGGVHSNSGIGNKAAYLMVDGGSFNGYTIAGIGIEKAARIFYEVQTNMLTSAADYNDLYDGLQQACTNLIGVSGITAFDCQQVRKAVDATEMNQQPAECRATQAPICPADRSPASLFFDDLEAGTDNWETGANIGTSEWYRGDYYPASGQYHLWRWDQADSADYYVYMTSDVRLPAGGRPYLHFKHAYAFLDIFSVPLDGGVVEYSTDGGSSWHDAGPLFTHNGYNGTIPLSDHPLGDRQAFVTGSNGYLSSRLDLSPLAGQNVRLRFRIGTSGAGVIALGWFIDDVHIYTCPTQSKSTPTPTPTPTGTGTIAATHTPTPTPAQTPTPSPADAENVELVGQLGGSTDGVVVAEGYAYVAAQDSGLRIVSISNPATPAEVGFYDTPGEARDVVMAGGYAYVAAGYAGLRIIDVSNPAAPAEVGAIPVGRVCRVPHRMAPSRS